MTDHPLTDDLAECIAPGAHWSSDIGEVVFTYNDMRAAADWQLDQMIKWAQKNCWYWFEKSSQKRFFTQELKKAMRPQENN